MKILITGASGFIGSFLCEEGLRQNMEVWAGMRKTSSRRYLQNERLNFAFLDLTAPSVLLDQVEKYRERIGRWDIIIHAGGATKCVNPADFDLHNYVCTKNLVEALAAHDMMPEQFIYVSSLSVLGPIREDYSEMREDDVPQPNTAYGRSKVKSEEWLDTYHKEHTDFNYVIFRPTGVYGPRERDYLMMAQSVCRHIDVSVGFKRQDITFVYVRDLVTAIFLAIGKPVCGRRFAISDGQTYSSADFSRLIQKELGVRFVLRLTLPIFVLRAVCALGGLVSKLTRRPVTLNSDKCAIMSQRNWRCDITPATEALGYHPQWTLELGVAETMAWYKQNKWL